MFVLRRLCKIGCGAIIVVVIIFISGCDNEKVYRESFSADEITDTMHLAGEITPDNGDIIRFTWKTEDLSVELFVEDSEQPAVVMINDVKYPFSYGCGYSPMDSEAPLIKILDANNDGYEDILIVGTSYRTELREDFYLSKENGTYTELGDFTWNKQDEAKTLLFKAEYTDTLSVEIRSDEWNILAEVPISKKLLYDVLIPIGVYDEKEKLTEYGASELFQLDQLQGDKIEYKIDDEGRLHVYYYALIEAGYSEYTLDCGFTFEYLISTEGYELEQVLLYEI